MNISSLYKYIIIEGNIGSGKTSLTNLLANDLECYKITEQFEENPFLSSFYSNPERYALPTELNFMLDRYQQISSNMKALLTEGKHIIADYSFIKTLLFAKNNLDLKEFELFKKLFGLLSTQLPKPDIIIYLYRSPEELMKFIKKRGRKIEKDIRFPYLMEIDKVYQNYFRGEKTFPIVFLDMGDMDFIQDDEVYNRLLLLLNHDFKKGLQQISLKNMPSKI